MKIKSLLLGSAAALVAATGAQAADAVVAPEPEAVQYVKVCDAYGAGYFYIPGTETCLRVGGFVRYDLRGGGSAYGQNDRRGWDGNGRFALRTWTGSETELGTLKTFTETRFNWGQNASGFSREYGDASQGTTLEFAYIQLGGLRVGLDESEFLEFTGYLGDMINDDVISTGTYKTAKISYTFTGGNGFSAVIALENGGYNDGGITNFNAAGNSIHDYTIDGYTPDIVGGLKYEGGWGKIAGVVAYDSVIKGVSAKVRGDVNITDKFSAWLQGAWSQKSTWDQNYGQWGGKWAVWGGFKYKVTPKAAFNLQAAHDDWGKTTLGANVAYEIVPGFTITPEVSWSHISNKWNNEYYAGTPYLKKDAIEGIVRFQRSF